MRRLETQLALALVMIGLAALPRHARADVAINPQAGVTGANMSSDPENITDKARLGYSFGGNLRLGRVGYIAPGAYYQRTSLRRTDRDNVTLTTITDNVSVHSVHLPVLLGFGLMTPSAGARSFGVRVFAGPAATIITKVDANQFNPPLTKDDFRQTTWGAMLGAGVDFSTLTFDASYEKGLTNELHGSDAKRNVIRGMLGVKL